MTFELGSIFARQGNFFVAKFFCAKSLELVSPCRLRGIPYFEWDIFKFDTPLVGMDSFMADNRKWFLRTAKRYNPWTLCVQLKESMNESWHLW